MAQVTLPNNWQPRPYQYGLWGYLENGGKRGVSVWHRRAGKDDVCLHWTAVSAHRHIGNYWHMLPEAAQARKAIWDAVNPHTGKKRIDEAFPAKVRSFTRNQEMMIGFKSGSTWQVVGSDNFDSLVGSPPIGVVFSEWPLSKQDAWAYLSPILEENGGWALFVYTPRGPNHGERTYKHALLADDWYGEKLTVDQTGVFTHEQLKKIKTESISQYGESRGLALYNQEYYCSFKEAHTGKRVYPNFNGVYHCSTEPLLKYVQEGIKGGKSIIRGWDNTGLSPACIVSYINSLGQWWLFKEFIGEDIKSAEFAENVNVWCNINLPNANFIDIGDPAGTYRDSRKGSPTEYIYNATGIKIEPGVQNLKTRIESVDQRLLRQVNGEPAFVVDQFECPIAVEGFEGGYCCKEIGETGYFHPEPEKNKFSHIQDAIQYPCTLLFPAGPKRDDYIIGQEGQTSHNETTGY